MQWERALPLGTVVLTAVLMAAAAVSAGQKRPLPFLARRNARYVGSQVCFACHWDVAQVWASLPHSQWMLDEKLPHHLRGCEACHGPGSLHVVARKGNIIVWRSLSVADQNAICLQCHQTVTADKWHYSPHGKGAGAKRPSPACTDCHDVHLPTRRRWMLKSATNQLCLRCHSDIVQKVRRDEHHSLARTQCAACHDPHDGAIAGMLKLTPTALCTRCHDLVQVTPADHTPEFVKGHGKQAKVNDRRCAACHGRDGCDRCHGVAMPHPKGFATAHGEATLNAPHTCTRCHDQSFCAKCHADAPPVSHDAADYAAKGHADEFRRLSRRAAAYCKTCHQRPFCDDCHRQKGIPLEAVERLSSPPALAP